MAGHGHQKEKTFADTLIAIVLVLLLVAVVYFVATNLTPFVSMMGEYFQLTPDDLVMIPVGIVVFFAFWRVCKRVVFDPCLLLIEEREKATEGAENSAVALEDEAKQLEQDYQEHFSKARSEAIVEKQALVAEAKSKMNIELENALQEADSLSKEAAKTLQGDLENFKSKTLGDAESMVDSIVDRVQRF